MAVGDIYQIRTVYTLGGGEEALNVFYYRCTDGTSTADDLNSAFVEQVWDKVRLMQTPTTVTTLYQAINGMNNSDYEESVASDAGLSAGLHVAARFIALGFRSPRVQPGLRYSYKRFGGVPINAMGSLEGQFDPTIYSTVYLIQQALGSSLEGDNAGYDPVQITGGFELGVTPTESTTLKGQWSFNIFPSSQVTRKATSWQVITP